MTLAKGLAGGLPIGACLCKEAADVFVPATTARPSPATRWSALPGRR